MTRHRNSPERLDGHWRLGVCLSCGLGLLLGLGAVLAAGTSARLGGGLGLAGLVLFAVGGGLLVAHLVLDRPRHRRIRSR